MKVQIAVYISEHEFTATQWKANVRPSDVAGIEKRTSLEHTVIRYTAQEIERDQFHTRVRPAGMWACTQACTVCWNDCAGFQTQASTVQRVMLKNMKDFRSGI